MAARHEALLAALDAMLAWLDEEQSQVAIFDATNSTEERRNFLVGAFRHMMAALVHARTTLVACVVSRECKITRTTLVACVVSGECKITP